MPQQSQINWDKIRDRATLFPEEAYAFVREGLTHTARRIHSRHSSSDLEPTEDPRHVSGQQLCMGLRELAVEKYGLLARTVLRRWGIHRTDDFGTIVYSLIDRGELRSSANDTIEDFANIYDFEESFPNPRNN